MGRPSLKAQKEEPRQVIWAPQEGKQSLALSCPFDEIFYGGAKGGGKSDFVIGDFLAHYEENRKWARGILFRETYPELEQLLARMKEIYPAVGAVYKESRKTWFFPGGATLKLRFVSNLKDAKKYQGHEYTWMAFDEVGNIAKREVVDILRGAIRNSKGVKSRLILTGNPQGEGHPWLFDRYIKGHEPMTPIVEERRLPSGLVVTWTRVFIPALLEDNPKLLESDPTYLIRLEDMAAGKPWLYQALRFGDWYAKPQVEGALWTQEVNDKFRIPASYLPKLKISRSVVAVDPSGSGNPAADECGIVAMGDRGDKHKYTLADWSIQAPPHVWASKAIKLYHHIEANAMVIERNFGGDMCRENIWNQDESIHIVEVNVTKGKWLRAEPVAALASKGYCHHVGTFQKLETEQTTWVNDGKHKSPNRLDAYVMAAHWLGGSSGLNIRDL